MSPASPSIERLRELYSSVFNRMREHEARPSHSPNGRPHLPSMEFLEPRLLLDGSAYLVIHAHNPEGVEIDSIAGVRADSVQIYDDQTFLGYGAHDAATHRTPIEVAAGTHTIRACFNGISQEQTVTLRSGTTRTLVFTFDRATYDLLGAINATSTTMQTGETYMPGLCDTSTGRFMWSFGVQVEPGSVQSISESASAEVSVSIADDRIVASGSATRPKYVLIEQSEPVTTVRTRVTVDSQGWWVRKQCDFSNAQAFENWFIQGMYYNAQTTALVSLTGNVYDPFDTKEMNIQLTPWGLYPGFEPDKIGTPYCLTTDKGIHYIEVAATAPSGAPLYESIYDSALGQDTAVANPIQATMGLKDVKMASVPYDVAGTGVKNNLGHPPVAGFTVAVIPPDKPKPPRLRTVDFNLMNLRNTVAFDATGKTSSPYATDIRHSFDPDVGDHLTYYWDFGDGETGVGPVVKHSYADIRDENHDGIPEDYTATLTVTDKDGLAATAQFAYRLNVPVVLVHGWRGNSSVWGPLEAQQLVVKNAPLDKTIGFYAFDYAPALGNPQAYAKRLEGDITDLRRYSGYEGQFDIVCHSMGALVSRWYMEELRHVDEIRQWIGVAPTTHGADIADLQPSVLATCLQAIKKLVPEAPNIFGLEKAVSELRTHSPTVKALNDNEDWINKAQYKVIAGVNDPKLEPQNSPPQFDSLLDWGKTIYDDGLTTLGDGLVPLARATLEGAGIDCFRLDHNDLPTSEVVCKRIMEYLLNPATESWGYVPPAQNGDVGPIAFAKNVKAFIRQGQSIITSFLVDPTVSQVSVAIDWPGSQMNLTLISPSGAEYAVGTTGVANYYKDDTCIWLSLDAPETGQWSARVDAIQVSRKGESFDLATLLTSPVSLGIGTQDARNTYKPGELVTLVARLGDDQSAVAGVSIHAQITRPDQRVDDLLLFDDGTHGDMVAGDGLYADGYVVPAGGEYSVTCLAGGTVDGSPVERTAPTTFWGVNGGKFGTIVGRNVPLTLTDTDGTRVTFSLRGPGVGEVVESLDGLELTLTGTGPKSSVTVNTARPKTQEDDGKVTFSSIRVGNFDDPLDATSLQSFTAATADLAGSLDVAGWIGQLVLGNVVRRNSPSRMRLGHAPAAGAMVKSIKLDDVADLSIESASPIQSLTVSEWRDEDGSGDEVFSPWVGSLTVKGNRSLGTRGDFGADIRLTGENTMNVSLGTLSVTGAVAGSVMTMPGVIGRANAGSWTGGGITAAGISSLVLATAYQADMNISGKISFFAAGGDISGQWQCQTVGSLLAKGSANGLDLWVRQPAAEGQTALGTMTVVACLEHSRVRCEGTINSFSAGAILFSSVLAGVTNPVDAEGPDNDGDGQGDADGVLDLPKTRNDFQPDGSAKINSLVVTGKVKWGAYSLVNSNIAASELGSIDLGFAKTNNGTPCGFAANQIGVIRCQTANPARNWTITSENIPVGRDFHVGDFVVRQLGGRAVPISLVDDGLAYEGFGHCVAIDGEYAVIQSETWSTSRNPTYVYHRDGAGWQRQAELTRADGGSLGYGVAIAGEYAMVGSSIFQRTGTTWAQVATLTAPGSAASNCTYALSKDFAFIGDCSANTSGSVYVFSRTGNTWSLSQTIGGGFPYSSVGRRLATDGNTLLVGCMFRNDFFFGPSSPSVMAFERTGSDWTHCGDIAGSGYMNCTSFGDSLAVSGDTAIVGIPLLSNGTTTECGGAYIYERSGSSSDWYESSRFIPTDAPSGARIGSSVAIGGNNAVVGGRNTVYEFCRTLGEWEAQNILTNPDGGQGGDFGMAVATDGDTVLIGAPHDGVGYAYFKGTVWTYQPGTTLRRPDLVVVDPSKTTIVAKIGQKVTVNVSVKNIGRANSGGWGFVTALYLSEDPTVATDDQLIGWPGYSSLGPGGSITRNITFNAPTTPGIYYLSALADSSNSVEESSKRNNWGVTITLVVA